MGYYYYHHVDHVRENYSSLICDLEEKRKTFLGVGTKKTKLALNKIAKTELNAKLLRLALEVEDKNINAKKYENYRQKYYDEKKDILKSLVKLCDENDIKVGISEDKNDEYLNILYFELPYCEQISWHVTKEDGFYDVKPYEGEWDGKTESTLPKLENAILKLFKDLSSKGEFLNIIEKFKS